MASEPTGVQAADQSPLEVETDESTARADWRSSVYGAVIVTLLIGLWLLASAGLLDYAKPALPIIWGIAIAFLSLLRLFGPIRSRTLALATAAAGAMAAITSFVASESTGETANVALLGLATVILALVGLAADSEESRASRP